jgi:hypothetical protein
LNCYHPPHTAWDSMKGGSCVTITCGCSRLLAILIRTPLSLSSSELGHDNGAVGLGSGRHTARAGISRGGGSGLLAKLDTVGVVLRGDVDGGVAAAGGMGGEGKQPGQEERR